MTMPKELLSHREAAEALQPYMTAAACWWLTDSRKRGAPVFRRGPLPPGVAERRGRQVFYERREIDRVIRELTVGGVTPPAPATTRTSISSYIVVPVVEDGEPTIQFRTDDGTLIVLRCAEARTFFVGVVPAIRLAEAWATASRPCPIAA